MTHRSENRPQGILSAVLELSEEIHLLRQEIVEIRGDLRLQWEENRHRDSEIWGRDGLSRMEAIRASLATQALQVKGIWATLMLLLSLVTSLVTHRLG